MGKRNKNRIKKMPRDQFEHVLNMNWAPVKLDGQAIPDWLAGIPPQVLNSVYASGTSFPDMPYTDEVIPSGYLIGGIDVYRNSPDDPVALNKDWYGVVTVAGSDSLLLIQGPICDSEHWLNDIPERLKGATIVSVPPLHTTSPNENSE